MAISSVVANNVIPAIGEDVHVLTYTKANAGDTIDLATYTPIKSIKFAKAQIDLAGADDPLTFSGTVVTLSTGTGAGRIIVFGTGQ